MATSSTLLFATTNPYKARLFTPLLAAHGIRCCTLADAGLPLSIEETGSTPRENALIKARAVHSRRWPLVFGDDAALEIDALGGAPGVQARRWNGRFAKGVADEVWLAHLLEQLADVPLEQRTARYHAVWAVITPDGREHVRPFCREFMIAERPLRPIAPGSPMSAVEIAPSHPELAVQIAAEWDRWGIWNLISQSANC